MTENESIASKEDEDKILRYKAYAAYRKKCDAEMEALVASRRDEIPTNDEIIALIPSRAEKEYLKKIGWQFSERDRLLLRIALAPESHGESEILYESGRYVTLPYPFRSGDIVSYVNGEDCDVGVFASCASDEDFKKWDEWAKQSNFLDFSDSGSTRVDFLEADGRFSHQHPSPLYLEYAALKDDDPRKPVLEIASELLRGTESSLETFQRLCEEYAGRGTDAAEDIIASRAKKLDAAFVWDADSEQRLLELNAALSAKEHAAFRAARTEAERVLSLGGLEKGESAPDGYEVCGAVVFLPDFDDAEKRLSLSADVLCRIRDKAEEAYTVFWDSRYDDLSKFDSADSYSRKWLEEWEEAEVAGKAFSLCESLRTMYRTGALSAKDLLALSPADFKVKVETTRIFA